MIVLHAHGQTCNKFFTYINFIADSIESGERIIILSPDITTRDYPNLLNSKLVRFPFYFEGIANLAGYETYIKWLFYFFGNKVSLMFLAFFLKPFPSVNFISAPTGSYKSPNQAKYIDKIRDIFNPHPQIVSEVKSIFESIRGKYEVICGVHIRYGDYRFYEGGKYFYTEKQYHSIMLNVRTLFPDRQIAFFVSSNEKIDLSVFSECNCFVIPTSTSTKDLCGLGLSDYIIGPPSTFSGWASFYGDTPLYFIEDPNEIVKLTSFKNISEIWS